MQLHRHQGDHGARATELQRESEFEASRCVVETYGAEDRDDKLGELIVARLEDVGRGALHTPAEEVGLGARHPLVATKEGGELGSRLLLQEGNGQ